jgi:anti-sigma regulatory factor (Ser/Thr protein kinase)
MSPLNDPPIPLDPDPQSVKQARVWVTEAMHRLDRDDLADAAELGVSELVTNAIMHATPPIMARVRGTRLHPRIEVLDHSPLPPAVNEDMAQEAHLLTTFGRGLGIIALYSVTWGAQVSASGKAVWFEPTAEPLLDGDAPPGLLHFEDGHDDRPVTPAGEMVTITLHAMPAQVFAAFRGWYLELRRELRLLSLVHGDDYPVARELTALYDRLDQERRMSTGVENLDRAIRDGEDRVDLVYHVPATAPVTMERMVELLDRADDWCREQRLLSLAATPQQRELWHWYLGEFVRQGRGEQPRPWPGSYQIHPRT